MKPKEKTQTRLEYATRAVIAALEAHNEKHPGVCIIKSELLPHASRRAGWLLEDSDDISLAEEAIGAPSEQFIKTRWSDICLRAAKNHHKYIVWEPRLGVRLGTFDEYQNIPNQTLATICQGLVDNCDDRAKVIVKQGGQTIVMNIRIKQLESENK
jgi:hypothetical protein